VKRLQIVFYGDPNGYPPIVNCARHLAAFAWEVEIICRDARTHAEVAWPPEAILRRIPASGGHRWAEYADFVRRAFRFARPDAIVAGHDMHGLVPAAMMALRSGAPLVYQCHDFAAVGRDLPAGSRIVKALEPALARRASAVIAPDERRAAVIRSRLRLASLPLVVPNAPRLAAKIPPAKLREALGRNGMHEKIVLRQGRIGPGHGIESTLRSMPLWAGTSWAFVLIGPADPGFARRMSSLADELGVSARFAMLPPVGYDEVAGFTREADLGHALYEPVNVNHAEMGTASNKVNEYMAAGIPSIVPDSASFASLLSAGCGLPVDVTSPANIAQAVNRILGDPALAREMGAAARGAFESRLHYERGGDALRARLEALLPVL
jgi:glycosyltransferase involved in cell wall biosynthesis